MRAVVVLICAALLGCSAEGPDESGDSETSGTPHEYDEELEPTQSLASPRFSHAATLLDDGRVLLVGGILGAPSQLDWDAFVAEVELFDPATESFEQGAALSFPRSWPSATRVADGRVVVLGGTTLNESTLSTPALAIEVWDPATESFSSPGELPTGVLSHCAVALGDQVLVIDDCGPNECTALRVDPDTGVTTLGGQPSYDYTLDVDCVALPDGRVFLAGGEDPMAITPPAPTNYAEVYDPASETFELVGPMPAAIGTKSRIITLDGGDVLMFGDSVGVGPLGILYHRSSGEFTEIHGDVADRAEHSLTLLDDGRVLIVGGVLTETFELAPGLDILDPATGEFVSLTPSFAPRKGHTAVRLDSGIVLIAGGQDTVGNLADAYLFR